MADEEATTETFEQIQETQELSEPVPAIEEDASPTEPPDPTKKRDKMVIAAFVLGIVGTSLAAIALAVGVVALATHSGRPARFDRTVITEELDRGTSRGGVEDGRNTEEFERDSTREFRRGRGGTITEEEFTERWTERGNNGRGHRHMDLEELELLLEQQESVQSS